MQTIKDIISNKQASVLILALFVMVILLALGTTFVAVSVNEGATAERQRKIIKALNIAEAGVQRALYDLRRDFVGDASSPSWSDGSINGLSVGPNTASYYNLRSAVAFDGGTYTLEVKNVAGQGDELWLRSTGMFGNETHTIESYVKVECISPWCHSLFGGSGNSTTVVDGDVEARGSFLVLGTTLSDSDYAVDLTGSVTIAGNNHTGLAAGLDAKIPALPTRSFGGETVSTLDASLRVKAGLVGLSGSATVGETDATGNSLKETVDAAFVSDGYDGSQGSSSVYSDNGTSSVYDLGTAVSFPSLLDAYTGYNNFQDYLYNNSLVISASADLDKFESLKPDSNFSYSNANGSVSIDGAGNLSISGVVYLDNDGDLNIDIQGGDTTITYSGSGVLLVTGNVEIKANLVTDGNNSYPTDILGIMTPNDIVFDRASIDVMGIFYAENQIQILQQVDIIGSITSNYFDLSNTPIVYYSPDIANNIPSGMIQTSEQWYIKAVTWQSI